MIAGSPDGVESDQLHNWALMDGAADLVADGVGLVRCQSLRARVSRGV